MFTGLVRERARVLSYDDGRLVVESGISAGIGDSIAVDGVCITVVENGGGRLALGGHYVQGHVDGVARVRALTPDGDGARLSLEVPRDLLRYCVEKGSLAVDGVSLTIAALDEDGVEIALVPHTLRETTLAGLRSGEA